MYLQQDDEGDEDDDGMTQITQNTYTVEENDFDNDLMADIDAAFDAEYDEDIDHDNNVVESSDGEDAA